MKCLEDLVSIHLVPRQDLTKEHPIDAQDQCLSDRLVRNTGLEQLLNGAPPASMAQTIRGSFTALR